MSRYFIKTVLLISLIFGSSFITFGQSKTELQKKKEKLLEDIAYTNRLLKETEKDKEFSLGQLVKLNKKISVREQLILTISAQINALDKQIRANEEKILVLEAELKKLKDEYAKIVYYSYKNRNSYDKLMFVLSSESFNQAYKRVKYFQQYSEFRKRQAELIIDTEEEIRFQNKELEAQRDRKRVLLDSKEDEKVLLAKEKEEQKYTIDKLKHKERTLQDDLSKKQQAANRLNKAIEELIQKEIEAARLAAKKKGESEKGFPMTPEAIKLSSSFAANKGSLPWPVAEGIITGKFGDYPHPVLKQVTLKNNGINISTSKGAMARAIFDGEVSSVVIIPGAGKAVFVRHGEYLSVYSYLSKVFVTKGDKVLAKQDLGVLIEEEGKTEVILQIWKGTTKLNPEFWIFKQ